MPETATSSNTLSKTPLSLSPNHPNNAPRCPSTDKCTHTLPTAADNLDEWWTGKLDYRWRRQLVTENGIKRHLSFQEHQNDLYETLESQHEEYQIISVAMDELAVEIERAEALLAAAKRQMTELAASRLHQHNERLQTESHLEAFSKLESAWSRQLRQTRATTEV